MAETTTRIADLPQENITMQMPVQSPSIPGFVSGAAQNTYIPMNIHQNPYGQGQPDVMANPQYQNKLDVPFPNNLTPDQQSMVMNYPKQNLPSRDIRVDPTEYTHDEQSRANYIPQTYYKDYIQEDEEETEKIVDKHKKKQHRERLIDIILNKIQTPLFIAILYFIFQMPIVNTLLYKSFKIMNLYGEDGNMNIYGSFLKSILFGCLFYFSTIIIDYISEL